MLIKTINFNNKLLKDIRWININKNSNFFIKGSYGYKKYGSIISDIDIQNNVFYNEKLLKIIKNILDNNKSNKSPFEFIQLSCGLYDEFIVPWDINEEGECDFENKKAEIWFDKFSGLNLVSQNILEYIKKKLEYPTIKNLIDIETILDSYGEILWTPYDIKNGFKIYRNKKYYLLEEMKLETPVLEFLYKYNDQYVSIDLGLVDRNFKPKIKEKMYKFYTNNWYKIFKTYRWKLKDKREYDYNMSKIEFLISVNYEIELFKKLVKHKLEYKNLQNIIKKDLKFLNIEYETKNTNQIQNEINGRINSFCKKMVYKFIPSLKPEFYMSIKLNLYRGEKSNILVNKSLFTPLNNKNFKIIGDLSLRLDLNIHFTLNCFIVCSKKMKLSLKDIIKLVIGNNKLSIEIIDENYFMVRNNFKKIAKLKLKNINKIREKIITSNY